MGTVKYSGPVVSFHCPTNAEIRSLKVHFSPKQEGSGDPSPENVREIVGWDGVEQYYSKKNMGHIVGYSASANINRTKTNTYGTTINTINYEGIHGEVIITQTQAPESSDVIHYKNGYIVFYPDNLVWGHRYNISFRVSNVISNPLNTTINNFRLINPYGNQATAVEVIEDKIYFKNVLNKQRSDMPTLTGFDIRICGMSCTISDIMITSADNEDEVYEPYQGSTINYEFGVLGKNKLDKNSYTYLNSSLIYFGGDNSFEPDGSLFLKAGTYTFSVSTIANAIFASDANKQNIAFTSNTNAATFTLQESIAVRIGCYVQGATNEELLAYNYQLELGSTATAYEPYDPKHTVYGGWVDLISGEVCEEWGSKIINGSESWSTQAPHDNFARIFLCNSTNSTMIGNSSLSKPNGMADILDVVKQNSDEKSGGRLCCRFGWGDKNFYILNAVENIPEVTDVASLKEYLSEHNIHIVYNLQTQYYNTYHIAPTALQTFLGQNNVWSNADYVEVEYDLHETQAILARKQFIVANQPHIVKPAAAPLQNFTTDVAAPLKECKIGFEPVQDLHGYSNPWPAGGGKNIAKPYDNNYVSSTYISFDYSAANGTFRCYGTASASSTHSSPSATNAVNNGATFTLPAGTYTLSIIDGDGANIYAQCVSSDETVLAETTSYTTFTTNESLTMFVRLKVAAAATVDKTVKIQLEAGSTATSYVPYENICPISGWTGVNVKQTGKNLFDKEFLSDIQNYPISGAYSYNYTNSILLIPNTTYKLSPTSTNQLDTGNYYVLRTGEYNTGTIYYPVTAGKPMVITFTTSSTGKICFGTYLTSDALPLFMSVNWQLEIGSTATSYEPYTGTTIPITFPSVTNILNSTTITTNKTLSAAGEETSETGMSVTNYIKVNEGDTYKLTFTSKEGARTRRIWSYNASKEPIEYLASASWVTVDTVGSLQATIPSGVEYIRVCYKTADEDIFLEGPESSVIYGGYVDLVTGEIWKEWHLYKLPRLMDSNCIIASQYYIKSDAIDLFVYPPTDLRQYPSEGATFIAYSPMCNRLDFKPKNIWSTVGYPNCWTLNGGQIHFNISNDLLGITDYTQESTTTAKAKVIDYMNSMYDAGNYFEFAYKIKPILLATLTPTQLKTLRGTNNIWANNNGGNIEVSFWRH